MRLIFMTSSSSLSGGTRQAMYLATALTKRGHDLKFFVPHNAEITALDKSVDWQHLPEKRNQWFGSVQKALPDVGEPCVLHAFHNKANKRLAWWGLRWRKRGCVCLGYRGVIYRPSNPLPYWSPGIDCFTVNSHACARVLGTVGLTQGRREVIYNGIPTKRVTPMQPADAVRNMLGLEHKELVFGSVAGDKPVKGVKYLLQGFAKAKDEGLKARLVIVGAREHHWRAMADELGLGSKVIFVGRVENVADYLQTFDVFVLPSLSESMPNVLLEAFFFGLPIIGSDVGGVPELVADNGLLVQPKDAPALTQAMLKMAGDSDLRKIWGKASEAKSAQFTIETKVKNTLALYNRLLKKRGLAAGL